MLPIFERGISLKVQIYGLILAICLFSFFTRMVSDINSTRDYLQKQMSSHAQDTATSLGLSISSYLDEENLMIAQTMATAIFDSGYYEQISFTNTQSKQLFELKNPKQVDSVPAWFVDTVKLQAPVMHSEINDGWIMAGTLSVTSHTGQSYLTLWQHTKRSLYSSFLLLIASLALAFLILRTVFKSLRTVEKQAYLVTRKRFRINNDVPIARELRTVTTAINNMVLNLQKTFESLTKQTETLTEQVYLDQLTGLGNRKAFESHFKSVVHSINDEHPLTAAMITLPSLANINQKISYQDGDEYVLKVAAILKQFGRGLTNSKLFRLNGSTFIMLAPYDSQFLAKTRIELMGQFDLKRNELHIDGFANIAVTAVENNCELAELLSELDTGCTFGEAVVQPDTSHETIFSVKEWKSLINSIIESATLSFSVQPVERASAKNSQCYFEVFAHFIHHGEKVNNGHLFAMAEKLNLTEELDKKLIRSFVDIKEQFPKDVFALNISKSSLYSAEFITWLKLYAHTKPILKNNLVFELNETSLLYNVQTASLHIDAIKEIGINVCIEHFGTSLTSFKYLQGLDVEYVKIDGSYIQDLDDNNQNQFFIQTVNNICHGFGIKVLACLIEKESTLQLVKQLGCDGVQGNLVMRPEKVIENNEKNDKNLFTFRTGTLKFCN